MTDEEAIPPPYKLFTSKAISVGAFFGGPLAVTVLLANNFGRMGDRRNRNRTYILGLGITLSMVWILTTTPQSILDKIPNIAYSAILSWIGYLLTEKLQGNILRKHFESLGQKASGWAVCGWSVLSVVVYFGIAFLFFPLIPPYDFEEEVYTEGLLGNEIYYSENIDTNTLAKLGEFFLETEYFTSEFPFAIQVIKEENGYSITLPCTRDYWDVPDTIKEFKDYGEWISEDVLKRPLSVSLVDEDFGGVYRKTLTRISKPK